MDSINRKLETTHPQKRIWYNEIVFHNTPMHNIIFKIHIGSNLDIHLLEKAINLIIKKNDSFRFKFYEEEGKLYQYVDEYKFTNIPFLDFTIYNNNDEKKLREFCINEGRKILYKQNELLFKFFIYKINDKKMGVCCFIHHLICDGMSCNLLLKQLSDIYKQLCNNEVVESNVENSYIDFIVDEKKYLNSEEFKKNKKFWNKKFSNLNENSLYTNSKCAKSETKSFLLKEDKCEELKKFLNKHNISINRFFISVSSIYMSRILNDNDITLAVACFNRSNERQRNTIGMFTGTMPLRINIEDNITFNEFLDYLNKELKSCYLNQKYPYDLLVQDLELKKRRVDSLFKFCVNYYALESYNLEASNCISISNEIFAPEYTNIALHILIKELKKDGNIELEVQYRMEDYTEQQIIQMVKGMELIANQIIENSNIKISEIQVVSEEEKNIILNKFNNTKRKYAKNKTIKELFEEVVEKLQDKIALVSNGEHLTFKELNERANQLGNLLVKEGVSKEDIVSILCDRSIDTIIGMLAIIKSGAAYLPIDEDYPEARIKYIIEDSGSKILLIKKHQLEKVNLKKINMQLIDLNSEEIFKKSKENLKNINTPKDLVYVIYTSGSTGNPKGVCIENINLVKLVGNPDYIKIKDNDKVLQSGSLSFDASVFQIWLALLNGITLHLEEKTLIINDTALESYINENKITIMIMPTALFNQHCENKIETFKNLRYLMAGGEVISSKQVSKITSACKNLKILNGYGPTENTIMSTMYEVKKKWDENIAVPIGTPISNSTAYIMDKNNNLLPIGVPGELCVGGDGIARGYLNREELTKEKFLENPYVKGERIYKTGDLAKWLPDGNIHFMGRIDYQVKINGFRIELQEIEVKLLKYSKLKEAVVVDKKDQSGNKYLCAYVVSNKKITIPELREHLSKELPKYMVPAYFMQLEKIPLTHNGKIDIRALPEPNGQIDTGIEYIAPRNEIEEKLAKVWNQILDVERIGVDDDFFTLGGHSLKAVKMMSIIQKELAVSVSVSQIFKNSTIRTLGEYVEKIKGSSYSSIGTVKEREVYKVSSAQKRMFALNQLAKKETNYNIPSVMILEGKLEKSKVEDAFRKLVKRHEALRTSFVLVDGEIMQRIHAKTAFKVQYKEIENSSEKVIDNEVDKFIKPFDLSEAPLIRVKLVKLQKEKHLLIIDMHHIISDGISMSIIMKEFSRLYKGETLENLMIQYKDYSAWENKILDSEVMKKQEEYWENIFSGDLPVLNLPTDYQRPNVQSFQGDSISFTLVKSLTEKLKNVGKANGATIYMTLLSAYNILLSRYSRQEDIIIGSPVAGRAHADLHNMIGVFINTLAMRNYPEGVKTFNEFLQEVKENTLMALENQNYQFDKLVEKLEIRRDLSRNPLFDAMFVLQNTDNKEIQIDNIKIQQYQYDSKISKFDMTLEAVEDEEEIQLNLRYCTKLFKRDTIERMLNHFENILSEIIANPQIKLADIKMLSEEEERKILIDFNDTKADFKDIMCVHQLFEEQAAEIPDYIAVNFEGRHYTYKELNEKANQLANYFNTTKVGVGSKVVIYMDRSLEIVLGLLGTLKAGAAYIPIDPTYPKDRVQYMIKENSVSVIITTSDLIGNVENVKEAKKLCIDAQWNLVESYSKENLNLNISSSDPAYIIFTSGSTGKPKGVIIKHKNIINYAQGIVKRLELQRGLSYAVVTTFAADLGLTALWGALSSGGQLHIISYDRATDPISFEAYFKNNSIDVLKIVPSHFDMLKATANIENIIPNKYLIFGGESSNWETISNIKAIKPECTIVNHYGPTETTVGVLTYKILDISEKENMQSVPLGKPLANSRAYILDEFMKPVPVGVLGELYIGGDGVAEGYLNSSELTKEKFITHSFLGEAEQTIYRTGDLARFLKDGNIEFLGRIDNQVKIRGYRIEIGEIEALIKGYHSIQDAVVIVREDKIGENRLVAYIVSNADDNEKYSEMSLREYLKKQLPRYMVPTIFVQVENIPLNTNGKVDRLALPVPDISQRNQDDSFVAPRNKEEIEIAKIWSEVLGIEKIGIDDDFFDLGGDSFKAIKIMTIMQRELQILIPVSELFYNPTIRQIGECIGKAEEIICSSIELAEPIKAIGENEFYKVSSAQKRMFALNEFAKEETNYNIPSVMILEGEVEKNRIEEAFKSLVKRHDVFRTSFGLVDGEIMQKIHKEIQFNVEYEELVNCSERIIKSEIERFIKPFDLSKAPVLRVKLIKFEEEKYALMFDMHHIISDGISRGIVMKEFTKFYKGENLEELRIQYKDYSAWESKMIESEDIKKQEKYWTNIFSDEIPVLDLPTDYQRPSIQRFEGETIKFSLDKNLAEALNKLGKTNGATLYMTLLSIYNILLSKYSSQEDIIIGSPIAGRPHAELYSMMGIFVNTLAMRNYPLGIKTFNEFLQEVKSNALNAYENQDYQFDMLVEKLNIRKDLSRSALFDVMFVLQNTDNTEVTIDNIGIKTYEFENKISKFDILLTAVETSEGIDLYLEYSTNLFKRETIERLIKHFKNILKTVIDNPEIKLAEIDMLSEKEKRDILVGFNSTNTEYPRDKTINELFEDYVEKTPEKIAVVFKDKKLTYRELNQRANALARILREKGVGQDSVVGIMAERSLEIIVGILSILKAGGAYLPIDSDYPKDRIEYILEDSKAAVLLATERFTSEISFEGTIISLNDERFYIENKENLNKVNGAENLAYIIYTSGTTGKPKGVSVIQRNVVRLVKNTNYIGFKVEDRILQTGSIAFDASTFEIWGALLNGIELHITSKDVILDARRLGEYLSENKITILWLTSPLFNKLCEEDSRIFKGVRCLLVGGDVVSPKNVNLIRSYEPQLIVVNGYGPTENTTFSTCYIIDKELDENKPLPIGSPIANSTAYILDKNDKIVPVGVQGELCVGGDGLARGYINNEELTAQRFLDNPYEQGQRMYRTGDLAKWLPDGNIEFLGRMDHQVKIRGFRIELGEIENSILKLEGINETLIIDIEEEGEKYLCAYLVSDIEYNAREIREELKKSLPDYMIPSYFITLSEMPLNQNGKIDRNALPKPNGNIETGVEYAAPSNEVEERLEKVWSEVLGVEKIGVNADFFTLGGNSLKAISVVSRLAKEFSISINDIFKYPTIQKLALNIKLKKETLNLNTKQAQEQVDTIKFMEENQIPKAIKSLYDSYIGDIERYTNFDLNSETIYKNILLTGATGYVGINILKELMLSTHSKIHLLLRGKDIIEAEERIIQKTKFYFGHEFYAKYKHRINILIGNISENYLGLDTGTYEKLSLEIDCIINSAANVKHYGKYEEFYNINVLGTKHLLNFAEEGLIKDFNQISTISIGSGNISNKNLVMFSESDIDLGQERDNVYVGSKLEAEKLVEEAGKKSLNTKIFRLGNVTFNYETGLFQENISENAFYKNIRAFIKLNCIPKINGNIFDFSYVDQLSRAVILLFNKQNCNNQVFHIENPKKISTIDLVEVLRIKYKDIELKDMDEFMSYISSKGEDERSRKYVDDIMVHLGLLESNNLTTFIIVSDRTNAILKKLGFEWSKLDKEAAKRMLDYCEKVNFV